MFNRILGYHQMLFDAIAETIRAEFPDQFENTAAASEKIAAILRGKTLG